MWITAPTPTIRSVYCTVYLYSIKCTLSTSTRRSVLCTLYSARSVQCTESTFVQFTVFCVLHIHLLSGQFYVHCIVHSEQ